MFLPLLCLAYTRHHSFPTRRSSDLAPLAMPKSRSMVPNSASAAGVACAAGEADRESIASPPRSVEHTSELQSRGQLVCRLVLEKKKAIICLAHNHKPGTITDCRYSY